MRRILALLLVLLLSAPALVEAGRRTEIRLRVPAPYPASSRRQEVIVLGAITDNRRFEDRPAQASTPSIAEGGVKSVPAKDRAFYIARVRDGYGKARNNIFLGRAQPVEEVVRELLTKSLAGEGYTVAGDAGKAGGRVITIDVEIDEFWGYIEIRGGSMPKMAGRIRTVLNVKGPGGKGGRYEVSGSALHGFGLMTGEHWVQMFEELFLDYQKDLIRVKF